MATNTINFNLNLPDENDFYDINLENDNMKKIDMALAENKQAVINHENKNDQHLTNEQSEKIENAIPKVEVFTPGNFAKINEDGTISDSGINKENVQDSTHSSSSIVSEKGVHNLRYHNEVVQFFDGEKWLDITSKTVIQAKIKCDIGATITATDGITTRTAIAESDNVTMIIPNFGTWNFISRLGDDISDTVTVTIDTVTVYNIDLLIISASVTLENLEYSNEYLLRIKNVNTDTTQDIKLSFNDLILDGSSYKYTHEFDDEGVYDVTLIRQKSYADCLSETITLNVTTKFEHIYTPQFAHTIFITEKNYPTNKVIELYEYPSGTTLLYSIPYEGTSTNFLLPDNKKYMMITKNDRGQTECNTSTTNAYDNGTETCTIYFDPIYGVKIDFTKSDPSAMVEYIDDAVGMTPGSSAWDDTDLFDDINPYSYTFKQLKNGDYDIVNPKNFSKLTNGSSVPYNGNIFVSFPILQYKIEYNQSIMTIRLSKYWTGKTRGLNDGWQKFTNKRFLNIAAYASTMYSTLDIDVSTRGTAYPGKKYSEYAEVPIVSDIKGTWNEYGIKMMPYRIWLMLQCLFVIRYKSLNSQAVLGNGYVEQSSSVAGTSLDSKGMYYGGNDGVKFCGLSHLWGNVRQFISEIYVEKYYSTYKFGYLDVDGKVTKIDVSRNYGFPTKPNNNALPFITKFNADKESLDGSSSTYLCDFQSVSLPPSSLSTAKYVARVGGYYNGKQNAGMFNIDFGLLESDSEYATSTRYIMEYN